MQKSDDELNAIDEAPSLPEVHIEPEFEYAIGQYVGINLEHPIGSRFVSNILDIWAGRVISHRVLSYGLIKTNNVKQCLVSWEDNGVEYQKTWVDCDQLLPIEEAISKVQMVIDRLVRDSSHPSVPPAMEQTGDIDIPRENQ